MGLDVSHDCWCGSYTAFNRWRAAMAELAELPSRRGMKRWEPYKGDPLVVLLDHSDCGGEIAHKDCKPLADRLLELAKIDPEHWASERAETFARGLLWAHEQGDDVEFC